MRRFLSIFKHWVNERNDVRSLSLLGRICRVFWFSGRRFAIDQHSQRAIALTYYTLFAVVPVAALSFGIAKGFALEVRLEKLLLARFPQHEDILSWIFQFANSTLREARGGIVAGAGVIALIWSVLWLATCIEKAFNAIWGLPTRRNIFRRFSDYLSILLLTPILLVLMSSAGVLIRNIWGKVLLRTPWLGEAGMGIAGIVIDVFPIIVVCTVFSLIYIMVPNTRIRILSAIFGGIVAGVLFQLLQDAFLLMQGALFRYNKIYGSFSILPLFLIWLQWSWQIALFGAEIAFVDQNLGSGLFDRPQEQHLSHRMRREYELAVYALVYKNFHEGKGPVTESAIINLLGISSVMVEVLLDEMLEAGGILEIDTEGDERMFSPGFSPENFTIAQGMALLDHYGVDVPLNGVHKPMEPIHDSLTALAVVEEKSPANRLIREL